MTRMSQCVADLKPFGHGFGLGIFQKKPTEKGWLQCKVLHFFKKISKYQRFSLGNLPQKTEGIVSAASRSAKKKTWQLGVSPPVKSGQIFVDFGGG